MQKGNLIVEFDIEYPNSLNPGTRPKQLYPIIYSYLFLFNLKFIDSKEYVRRALLVSPTQLKKLEAKQKAAAASKNAAQFQYEEED